MGGAPTTEPGKKETALPVRDGYGKGLVALGKVNPRVVALDADLQDSTRAIWFQKEFPDRFIQMGIAEQDMVVTAAGLAATGKIPFASSFAIFGERAFEQVRNSIARTKANVKLAGSHGGIQIGEDGSSAQCIEDIAIYRALPNMVVVVPSDAVEAEKAVFAFAEHQGPCYMRTTRNKLPITHGDDFVFRIGKGEMLRPGNDVAIIACGSLVAEAVQAAETLKAEGLQARVINMSTIKPLDTALVIQAARECGAVVTAEDHNIIGGLGSAVCEVLAEEHPVPVQRVGVRDTFGESGTPAELYEKYGLTAKHVAAAARRAVERKKGKR
ncbi:MAG TPA: transketolase family protein [Candidatus Thermoplasmatota archaeon]|jgi:transketolase|nr:transketolase family protein [Candidatus Thermoplasmatota archaeon]